MTRLTLKESIVSKNGEKKIGYGDVGDLLAKMSTLAAKEGRKKAFDTYMLEFVGFFQTRFRNVQYVQDEVPDIFEDGDVQLNFHFDRTVTVIEDGTDRPKKLRVVNVVVPDVDSKLLDADPAELREALGDADGSLIKSILDLREIARESMGFIVICGCAN